MIFFKKINALHILFFLANASNQLQASENPRFNRLKQLCTSTQHTGFESEAECINYIQKYGKSVLKTVENDLRNALDDLNDVEAGRNRCCGCHHMTLEEASEQVAQAKNKINFVTINYDKIKEIIKPKNN